MTALTNAQKQAKHRLAVKERMARMEEALQQIIAMSKITSPTIDEYNAGVWRAWHIASKIASAALSAPSTPTTTPKTPE